MTRHNSHNISLIQAVKSNDLAQVEHFIECGSSVNARDSDSCAALHHAAKASGESIVNYLLDKGAYIDAADSQGKTALICCAQLPPKKTTTENPPQKTYEYSH